MVPHLQLSPNYGLDCLLIAKKNSMHQQPILQLVDDCPSGKVTFPLYRDFPGWHITVFQKIEQFLKCGRTNVVKVEIYYITSVYSFRVIYRLLDMGNKIWWVIVNACDCDCDCDCYCYCYCLDQFLSIF